MVAIEWNLAERPFYAGIDSGVVYIDGQPGQAWSGLVSVTEDISANVDTSRYLDGIRYALPESPDDFGLKVTAYTYPDNLAECMGELGIYDNQPSKLFNLSYRTGDAENGQLHLVYNAIATPVNKGYSTLDDGSDASLFSWTISTAPVEIPYLAPSAHFVIDLKTVQAPVLANIKTKLYGSSSTDPTFPSVSELMDIFAAYALFQVVDNGDGTWTATGPDNVITTPAPGEFQINYHTLRYNDETTYRMNSG